MIKLAQIPLLDFTVHIIAVRTIACPEVFAD
jgi:hypothetical protein